MLIIVENYIHNWLPPTRIVTLNNPKYKSNSTFIYSLYFLCAHDPSSTWIFSYIIHLITLLYESISMKVLVTFQPIYVGPTRTEGTWLDDPYILIQGFVAWKLYVSIDWIIIQRLNLQFKYETECSNEIVYALATTN